MFSDSMQLNPKPKEAPLAKSVDTSSEPVSHFPAFLELQKKIETKQSLLSPSVKSSIISDCGYNSGIYEWRKVEPAPIVRVIELAKRSQIDVLTGRSCTHNTIKPEPIQCNLSNFQQFSKQQMLYICKNMLEGHQAIFKKMKATSVSLDKCVVTLDGEVKVWVNQHLERNDISGEILSKEQTITRRIFQTVSFLAAQNIEHKLTEFLGYIDASTKKSGKWTFVALKAMLKSYADCLKIKIAKNITFKKTPPINHAYNPKRPIQSSMVENKTSLFASRPRQTSFEFSQRNIQSSMNCSRNSAFETNSILFGTFLESLTKNPTCKSINQNEKSRTARTLTKNQKHTNSISLFKTQEDTILEKSVNHVQQEGKGQEHRKIPSIGDILAQKIGFSSLPEVQCDDQYSNEPSARKETTRRQSLQNRLNLVIASQFSLTIEKPLIQRTKPDKESSISTTNQTSISANRLCFSKKVKQSHLTITMDDKENSNSKDNNQFRTASRDRFKDSLMVPMSEQAKKVVGSCTNWSSGDYRQATQFQLTNLIKEVRVSTLEDPAESKAEEFKDNFEVNLQVHQSPSKMEIQSQVVSFKSVAEIKQKPQSLTPVKSTKQIIKQYLKNPLGLLNELRSQQELESYDNTEKASSMAESPSPSVRKIRVPIQEKVLELLQINRNLVVSTYMETNSEKKIKETETPDKERQKRLKDIEETLSELVKANLKQQEVLQVNSWTKRLQNLLGIQDELKESISFGPEEANALLREIKMSKLGRIGRDIGNSLIPE